MLNKSMLNTRAWDMVQRKLDREFDKQGGKGTIVAPNSWYATYQDRFHHTLLETGYIVVKYNEFETVVRKPNKQLSRTESIFEKMNSKMEINPSTKWLELDMNNGDTLYLQSTGKNNDTWKDEFKVIKNKVEKDLWIVGGSVETVGTMMEIAVWINTNY